LPVLQTGRPVEEAKALERAGVLRYFVRIAEKIVWADRPEELMEDLLQGQELPPGVDPPLPMSVTFIPATVFDNPALLRVNPEYLAWLLSLPRKLERERLLAGNWKIRPAAGLNFNLSEPAHRQNQAANCSGRCTRSLARIQNRSSRPKVTPTA